MKPFPFFPLSPSIFSFLSLPSSHPIFPSSFFLTFQDLCAALSNLPSDTGQGAQGLHVGVCLPHAVKGRAFQEEGTVWAWDRMGPLGPQKVGLQYRLEGVRVELRVCDSVAVFPTCTPHVGWSALVTRCRVGLDKTLFSSVLGPSWPWWPQERFTSIGT